MNRWWRHLTERADALPELHSPGEVWLFLRILAFSAAVPLLMRMPILKLGRWLEPKALVPEADPQEVARIIDYADRAIRVGRPLVRSSCLTRGLTLYTFLRRAGLDVRLCFGAGRTDQPFTAHCWLVKDGRPFLEKAEPESQFTPMFSLPEQAR